jgi:flagellar protein FlaG
MGIQIAAVGAMSQQQEPVSQDRALRQQQALVQVRAAEARSAAIEKFEAALPGNREQGDINSTVADLERVGLAFNRKLKFVVDHQSHEVTVKVIDPETDKVIKVLPPEELQRLHNKLKETIGFLFDERV